MPLKKDGNGKHWVEMELVVPGTPEQVWQAMATEGYAGWFTRVKIEGRVGGAIHFDFGEAGATSGEVTAWEPPNRIAYEERGWNGDAPPVATEIVIAARGGGQCVVRMVHSLFSSSDEWDDQIEGFENGWPGFFEVLKLYLAHFPGMKAASFMAAAPQESVDQLETWVRLLKRLELTGANVGESRRLPSDPEAMSGVVEHILQSSRQRWIIVRQQEPAPAIALIGTYGVGKAVNVSICMFVYGEDAEERAAMSEKAWRAWLKDDFSVRA